jgi:hypothetical protein
MKRGAAFLGLLAAAALAAASDPAWPPAPETQARIDQLRRTIGDPSSSTAERQAAREELVRLLMRPSPLGAAIAPMKPRAASDPAPRLKLPDPPSPAAPQVTPVSPPVRAPGPVSDGKGGTVIPGGQSAIDPRTGATLIDVGNGWLDPATGRFVPKH